MVKVFTQTCRTTGKEGKDKIQKALSLHGFAKTLRHCVQIFLLNTELNAEECDATEAEQNYLSS